MIIFIVRSGNSNGNSSVMQKNKSEAMSKVDVLLTGVVMIVVRPQASTREVKVAHESKCNNVTTSK